MELIKDRGLLWWNYAGDSVVGTIPCTRHSIASVCVTSSPCQPRFAVLCCMSSWHAHASRLPITTRPSLSQCFSLTKIPIFHFSFSQIDKRRVVSHLSSSPLAINSTARFSSGTVVLFISTELSDLPLCCFHVTTLCWSARWPSTTARSPIHRLHGLRSGSL